MDPSGLQPPPKPQVNTGFDTWETAVNKVKAWFTDENNYWNMGKSGVEAWLLVEMFKPSLPDAEDVAPQAAKALERAPLGKSLRPLQIADVGVEGIVQFSGTGQLVNNIAKIEVNYLKGKGVINSTMYSLEALARESGAASVEIAFTANNKSVGPWARRFVKNNPGWEYIFDPATTGTFAAPERGRLIKNL